MTKHRIGSVGDLDRGELRKVDVDGVAICLACTDDGEVFAIDDTCTHEAASLSDGELYKGSVQCPMHGSLFDVQDGSVTGMPAQVPVTTYPVSIVEGEILIDM